MEQTIKTTTLASFIKNLSGLFITKDNPAGITPKELTVLCALAHVSKGQKITKEMKVELSNMLNQSLQVTTNYLNKFKRKGIIMRDAVHPLLLKTRIVIEYDEQGSKTTSK